MENSNINSGSEVFRPKTRGELYDKIKEGVKCEVVASNGWVYEKVCLDELSNYHYR